MATYREQISSFDSSTLGWLIEQLQGIVEEGVFGAEMRLAVCQAELRRRMLLGPDLSNEEREIVRAYDREAAGGESASTEVVARRYCSVWERFLRKQ